MKMYKPPYPYCDVQRCFRHGGYNGKCAEHRIEELEAKLDRVQWQPIETAPKDGTSVLVSTSFGGVQVVHIAFYRSENEWNSEGQYLTGWSDLDDWLGWWSYTKGSVTQEKLEGVSAPTHWMPLPESPYYMMENGYEMTEEAKQQLIDGAVGDEDE
jgi:hypothetical protein